MSHYDTKTVVLTNKRITKDNAKKNASKKVISTTNSNQYQTKKIIEDDDIHKIETIGRELGQKIMQARVFKGWKQKDVSGKMNMQPSDYQKLENGTAPRNGQQLNKLGRIIGIKLTGKGV
jgi:ribosome-binding protein aMBF1 (putative translation factor)